MNQPRDKTHSPLRLFPSNWTSFQTCFATWSGDLRCFQSSKMSSEKNVFGSSFIGGLWVHWLPFVLSWGFWNRLFWNPYKLTSIMRWDVEFLSCFWWLHRVLQGLILTPSWVWAWYVYVVLSCVDVGRCWTLVPSQLIDPGDLQMHTGDNSCPLSVEILGVFDLLSSFSHGPWQLFFHAKLYPKIQKSHERKDTLDWEDILPITW